MNRSATFLTEEIASDCDLSIFLGGSLNESTRKAYTVLLYLIILNILSLPLTSVLNGLVIITVKTKPRLKTTSTVALACLATTDCVMRVIGQPFFAVQLAVLLQGERSSSYCPLLAASVYVIRVLGAATFLHLTVINIERYIAIKHSLKYKILVTRGRLLRGSAFVWVCFIPPNSTSEFRRQRNLLGCQQYDGLLMGGYRYFLSNCDSPGDSTS